MNLQGAVTLCKLPYTRQRGDQYRVRPNHLALFAGRGQSTRGGASTTLGSAPDQQRLLRPLEPIFPPEPNVSR